ncbi:MAG: hypothetical protein WBF33_17035 [Candidatus Nitrosopolaris sp.]
MSLQRIWIKEVKRTADEARKDGGRRRPTRRFSSSLEGALRINHR